MEGKGDWPSACPRPVLERVNVPRSTTKALTQSRALCLTGSVDLIIRQSQATNRIDSHLEPGCDRLLPVTLPVFAVPDSKRNRL